MRKHASPGAGAMLPAIGDGHLRTVHGFETLGRQKWPIGQGCIETLQALRSLGQIDHDYTIKSFGDTGHTPRIGQSARESTAVIWLRMFLRSRPVAAAPLSVHATKNV